MQTISTKFLCATNHRGSRIKATHEGNVHSVTASWDYGLNDMDNHKQVALRLMEKLGWTGKMIAGHTYDGMIWVFDNQNSPSIER